MHKLLIGITAALTLGSCVTTAPTRLLQRRFAPFTAVPAQVSLPVLNSEAKAQVGDTMIQGAKVFKRPAIQLLQPVIHRGYSVAPYTIQIPAGKLVASGTSTQGAVRGIFYEAPQGLQFNSAGGSQLVKGGIFILESPGHPPEIYWHATDTGVPIVDPEPAVRVERTEHEEWQRDSFRRELVYNGRSGATIKLLYREFSEERIRPAFSQEVTYDLERGETIGFKGARFQVMDADNIQIRYVVLHHFD